MIVEQLGKNIAQFFQKQNFQYIEIPILQPANLFLNKLGEDIRRRIYIVNDPAEHQKQKLCLRPDMTLPICLQHIKNKNNKKEIKYAYQGKVFRYNPEINPESLRVHEYYQAGVEWFNPENPVRAENEMINIIQQAIENNCKVKNTNLIIGDIRLFNALLEESAVGASLEKRLKRHFWRPDAFLTLLENAVKQNHIKKTDNPLPQKYKNKSIKEIIRWIENNIDTYETPIFGKRNIEDIAERLKQKANPEKKISKNVVQKIKNYLDIHAPPEKAFKKLKQISQGKYFTNTLNLIEEKITHIQKYHNFKNIIFSTQFGRKIEYYTGFVFQIEKQDGTSIAGGGQYDTLIKELGAKQNIPALGAAIHLDRLISKNQMGNEKK